MKPKLDYHPSFINILMRTVAVAFSVAASHDLVKAEVSPVPLTQLPINTAAEKAENIPVAGSLNFTNPTDKKAIDAPVPASLNPTTTTTENAPVPASLNPNTTTTENAPVPASLNPNTTTTENAPVPASLNPTTTTTTEVSQTTKVVKILTPSADEVLSSPATSVIVQFSIGSQIELRVNGELVDSSLIGRTETSPSTNLVTQTWYGVGLKEGKNTISAQLAGRVEPPEIVQVSIKGSATELKLESQASRIPADGRSTAVIQGQLLDKGGNRSEQDAVITLTPTAGKFLGADFKPDQPGFQIEAKEGIFVATLLSDTKAQTVRISATTTGLEGFTQLQFETALRPSLLTGVVDLRLGAKGTDYYSRYRDFLPTDKNNGTEVGFNSAIFATGAIGDWLFTGAYNSSRSLNEDCDCNTNLFASGSSSNQNYPAYGDSSRSEIVTPSISSVFARLERSSKVPGANPDYLMWGDYNTEELARPSQQFTSTSRQLNGFKTNYNLGNLAVTGFYSQYVKGFQRDTIAPDGTSGYYFLSRRILVGGSENVYLELEELNRPGTVVKRQKLERGTDYDFDYDRGTVLFKQPILRTSVDEYGQILVRKIIVSYEYDAENSDGDIYAGRLQYNLSGDSQQQSWLGTTFLQENQGLRDFQVYGADTQISLPNAGKITAEYAHSRNTSEVLGKVRGQAYRLEVAGQLFSSLKGRSYYSSVDTGFANNATTSFVPGQTRYGVQMTGRITTSTNLRWQYDHEDNFGIAPVARNTFEELFSPQTQATPGTPVDNSLTTINAGVQQRFGQTNLDVDWIYRQREDRMSVGAPSSSSQQLRSRLTVPIAKSLTFQAQNELSLSKQQDSVYPARTTFGLNWAAIPGVNVSLTHQLFNSGQSNGNSVTGLNVNGEQKLGQDTSLTGRYSIIGSANERTTQGAVGLKNRLTIAPGLRLSVAYEHVFGSFFSKNTTGQQFSQPFAFGQAGSAISFNSGDSYSVGLEYTDNPNFQASTKYEYRNSAGGTNTVISGSIIGKISPSLTALARYQQASSANQTLSLGDTINVKMGLAYRDINSDKFNALFRYEYRQNPATIPDTILIGSGTGSEDHTFAIEGIYAPNWQWEFYSKYALRNSTSYLASDLVGTSSVNLSQLRATYRLGYSMDLVGETRLITQGNYTETGFVLETGYYLNPNLRLAAGYAFGKVDDRDFSGTRSAGGAYLGLTLKLNELFEGFGQQKVAPKQQQESAIKANKAGNTGI
ncbi:TonB-dependent receptor [Aphanizomenon flos-aquae]|uniref:TonB-dependent receptor n=1 Tax=Aphanizomenon flos-aquae FACHB-1040 TaxID=2692887 RepID=A0ABR8C2J1_APHFL|nr:TonB-dependent receptor [Aphanizomenon flos-aquae]MBD2281252.1 TonB-dependent receptor [Aphanizomenon flos-aquae FACHB-1040]